MAIIEWPFCPLIPAHVSIFPDYATRGEQEATNGMRRSLGVTSSTFRLVLHDIVIASRDQQLALNAVLAHMEGNANLIRFRLPDIYGVDGRYTPEGKARRRLYPDGVPFASDALFDTDVGFNIPYRNGTLAAAANVGDRTIYIAEHGNLPGGALISIDDFVYTMRGTWEESVGVHRVEISPTLRKSAGTGAEVDYSPVFVGTCTTPTPGEAMRWRWKRSSVTLEFIEDLTRLVEDID